MSDPFMGHRAPVPDLSSATLGGLVSRAGDRGFGPWDRWRAQRDLEVVAVDLAREVLHLRGKFAAAEESVASAYQDLAACQAVLDGDPYAPVEEGEVAVRVRELRDDRDRKRSALVSAREEHLRRAAGDELNRALVSRLMLAMGVTDLDIARPTSAAQLVEMLLQRARELRVAERLAIQVWIADQSDAHRRRYGPGPYCQALDDLNDWLRSLP